MVPHFCAVPRPVVLLFWQLPVEMAIAGPLERVFGRVVDLEVGVYSTSTVEGADITNLEKVE
jgi:hypothetical protein